MKTFNTNANQPAINQTTHHEECTFEREARLLEEMNHKAIILSGIKEHYPCKGMYLINTSGSIRIEYMGHTYAVDVLGRVKHIPSGLEDPRDDIQIVICKDEVKWVVSYHNIKSIHHYDIDAYNDMLLDMKEEV